jgi:hypothetical protein
MLLLLLSIAAAEEFDTTARAGMGGAGTAAPGDLSSVRRAPGAMVLGVGKSTQVDAAFGQGTRLGTGMVDTQTNAFGAGFSYSREWADRIPPLDEQPGWLVSGEKTNEIRHNAYRVGLGYGFLQTPVSTPSGVQQIRRIGIGAGVVYEHNTSDLSGSTDSVEVDASVAFRPGPPGSLAQDLIVAATVHDLVPNQLRPINGEAGVWWRPIPQFQVAGDVVWDPRFSGSYVGGRAGIEVLMAQSISLSLGASRLEQDMLAGGIGVQAEGIAIRYAAQWTPASESFVHTVGLVGPL